MSVAFSPIWGVTLALGLGQNYTCSMWATLPILGGMTACVFDCCTGARLQLLLETYLPKFAFMEWIAQSRVTPCTVMGTSRQSSNKLTNPRDTATTQVRNSVIMSPSEAVTATPISSTM